MRIILLFFFCFSFLCSNAQRIIEKSFYEYRFGKKIKDSSKAEFITQSILEVDSVIHYQELNIKTGEVFVDKYFLKNLPVGVWTLNNEKYNYDFEVNYNYSNVDSIPILKPGTLDDKKVEGLQSASYADGDNALTRFLAMNIKYLGEARDLNIQGRVVAQFVINEDGSISDYAITKSLHPILDKETLRVARMFGKWNPCLLNGKPIKVIYMLPVTYKMAE